MTTESRAATGSEVVYLPFSLDGALAGQAAYVYARAFAGPPYYSDPLRMEIEYLRNLRERHVRKPGLTPIVAIDRGIAVGTAYGYHLPPADWWGDMVRARLDPAGLGDWLKDTFVIVEVAVLPARQGSGIGRGLLNALLDGRPEPCAILSTRVDAPAHHLYRSLGFDVVAEMTFVGNPSPYYIMGRQPAELLP